MIARTAASIGILFSLLPYPAGAQEATYDIRGCGMQESSLIDKVGDVVIMQTVTRGLVDSISPGAAFDKTTYECRAVVNASPAGVEFNNRCVFVDKDGHKTVGASAGTPKGWQWKFIGGSGKWEGISGGGPGVPETAYARLSSAVTGSCWRSKGTYSLKKM
jgi:hypothetical protein